MNEILERLRSVDPAADGDLPAVSLDEVRERATSPLAEVGGRPRRVAFVVASAAAVVLCVGLLALTRSRSDGPASSAGVALVFMAPEATQAQIDAVGARLVRDGFDIRFRTKAEVLEEFRRRYADAEEVLREAPDLAMPTSFELFGEPTNGMPLRDALADVNRMPGVLSVQVATEARGGAATSAAVETSVPNDATTRPATRTEIDRGDPGAGTPAP